MKLIALGLVLSTSLFLGCAGDTDEIATDTDSPALTGWSAVLRCEGVVVDVDATSRRHLQLVVSDAHAVAWLSAHPGSGGAGRANAKGEVILSGWTTTPVNGAADFTGFDQLGFAEEDALLPQAHVTREAGGLKVRLVVSAHGHEQETANWFFRGC